MIKYICIYNNGKDDFIIFILLYYGFNHWFFLMQHPTVLNKFAFFIFIFRISRCPFPYLWRHSSMMYDVKGTETDI
jgi:hypothetical protein